MTPRTSTGSWGRAWPPRGWLYLHAQDATEGLQATRDHLPDLILLDLDMPGTDGMTLCRQFKEDPDLVPIPVIFLTGTLDVATKVQAFDLGAIDYVTKPFDTIELKARVRAALRTKRYHDLLTTKARIDALTGLWNRGYLNDQLAMEISHLQRSDLALSLAMVDIDLFKPVNDTHGHPFGDRIIQGVAGALNRLSRDTDVVCRYGGEEFAIILRDTSSYGASVIAERMRAEIETLSFRLGRECIAVTVSIGVAGGDRFVETAELTGDALLQAADKALYEAKNQGRNRVVTG
ncbi:diguanylate cyclase [Halomonas daqiaonensis]|uniref:diguanylate cyclase n=1 Tax=Halomonas daqiaonensis TaxID=650850 RepID=A0A1H7QVM1_9GAMM|nr:diguanylate cyclase [Halomonas daqiaonensis]SEL51963.1 diguanylate cyclase (GGDEF) domain-containing protein [Halomonas daqiaonensis]